MQRMTTQKTPAPRDQKSTSSIDKQATEEMNALLTHAALYALKTQEGKTYGELEKGRAKMAEGQGLERIEILFPLTRFCNHTPLR